MDSSPAIISAGRENEQMPAVKQVSKFDAVKQIIFNDSKIEKKGVSGISVKIYPEND